MGRLSQNKSFFPLRRLGEKKGYAGSSGRRGTLASETESMVPLHCEMINIQVMKQKEQWE
jgi:hypothetical protein